MIPYQPRHPRPAVAPMPGASEQLTRLVYELLDAHDDTARIATGQHVDARWQAHLGYLRDLQRVARELLARAGQQEGAPTFAPVDAPTRGAGMLRCFRRLPIRILRRVIDRAALPNRKGGIR